MEINANIQILLQRTNGLEEKLENLTTRVTSSEDRMTARAEELQTHIQALENKIDELKNREQRNNLVIHGLTESPQESLSSLNTTVVKEIFEKHLEVSITSIERIHRLVKHKEGS